MYRILYVILTLLTPIIVTSIWKRKDKNADLNLVYWGSMYSILLYQVVLFIVMIVKGLIING